MLTKKHVFPHYNDQTGAVTLEVEKGGKLHYLGSSVPVGLVPDGNTEYSSLSFQVSPGAVEVIALEIRYVEHKGYTPGYTAFVVIRRSTDGSFAETDLSEVFAAVQGTVNCRGLGYDNAITLTAGDRTYTGDSNAHARAILLYALGRITDGALKDVFANQSEDEVQALMEMRLTIAQFPMTTRGLLDLLMQWIKEVLAARVEIATLRAQNDILRAR